MTPQGLRNWANSAWEVAGPTSPLLMGRYAVLTLLNRTSRERFIYEVPERAPTRARAAPSGDVVVPVYNNFDDTSALISVLETDDTIPGRIIVVHDCSTDARIAPLLRAYATRDSRVDLLENERNRGFVHTCNRGIQASRNDVVILNTDVELPRGAVRRILARLQADDKIATITPFSNSAYGVGIPDLLYDNPMPFGCTAEKLDAALGTLPSVTEIELASGIGFCMAMSRAVIAQTGGAFDPAFGLGYGEETDFCLRATDLGYRHVLAADCFVGHKGGKSFGSSWQDLARRGTLKVLHRHPTYVDRVAQYLETGRTRALGFAALVRLAEAVSGAPVQIEQSSGEGVTAKNESSPTLLITVREELCTATLVCAGEVHVCNFADEPALNAWLDLLLH